MQEFLLFHYEWLRAFHIISMVAWMAGMLYLPRLFVYHAETILKDGAGTVMSEIFKTMERRLLRYIMNPAMLATWLFGLAMLAANPAMLKGQGWMHAKLMLVLILGGAHGFFAKCQKDFESDQNKYSPFFYRVLNEVPTVIMIAVVILAVVQPF